MRIGSLSGVKRGLPAEKPRNTGGYVTKLAHVREPIHVCLEKGLSKAESEEATLCDGIKIRLSIMTHSEAEQFVMSRLR